jgi:hypothetical protein
MAEANPNPKPNPSSSWHVPSNTRSGLAPITRLPFVKRSMNRGTIMHPSSRVGMQCMKGEDGKFYYIPVDPYSHEHLIFINEMSPLLVNPTPRQFEKGALYTYIVASIIRKDPDTTRDIKEAPMKLYACKAQNMFEFGTKHHQIFYRMALTDELDNVAREKGIDVNQLQYALYASGEIKCMDPFTLVFNFFSGTYKMQRKIPTIKEPAEIELIRTLMKKIDPSYVIRDGLGRPFIVPETMSITHAQIRNLNAKGIPTFEFDTERQCRDMRIHVIRIKSTEKRTISHEEMREKYKQIVAPPPPQETNASRLSSFASAVASKAASLFPSFAASFTGSAPATFAPTSAYAMTTDELVKYANQYNLPIPDPFTKPDLIRRVQEHLTKSKLGGKKRTMKRRTLKKRV